VYRCARVLVRTDNQSITLAASSSALRSSEDHADDAHDVEQHVDGVDHELCHDNRDAHAVQICLELVQQGVQRRLLYRVAHAIVLELELRFEDMVSISSGEVMLRLHFQVLYTMFERFS
jgi:hypothetical protein